MRNLWTHSWTGNAQEIAVLPPPPPHIYATSTCIQLACRERVTVYGTMKQLAIVWIGRGKEDQEQLRIQRPLVVRGEDSSGGKDTGRRVGKLTSYSGCSLGIVWTAFSALPNMLERNSSGFLVGLDCDRLRECLPPEAEPEVFCGWALLSLTGSLVSGRMRWSRLNSGLPRDVYSFREAVTLCTE